MIVWLALAHAAPSEEAVVDYRSFLDQAKFFIKKGWLADAEEQLTQASRHPDGRLDPEIWFLLAQVRYDLADLAGAREAAEQALTMSREEHQATATRDWLAFLDQRFGVVEIVGPRPGVSARVSLELKGRILDPELQEWFARARERLDGAVDLPVVLGLPAGASYAIDGTEITVSPASHQTVEVDVRAAAIQRLELQLSPGIGSWTSATHTSNLYPAPSVELGVLVPIGPVVLATRGGGLWQAWEDADGGTRSALGWSVGGEAGVDAFPQRAIGLRTGLGLRAHTVDGLRVQCPTGCRSISPSPGWWTSLGWRDPGRSSGAGVGIRTSVEHASGRVDDTQWAAWGIRALLDLSWSL